jgi:DNA polymerase-3 subunit epsilon
MVALDFETTGLDPKTDEVISFGAVPIVGGRIRTALAETEVIDPGKAPSQESIRVHQLRPVDVAGGTSKGDGMAALSRVIAEDPIVVWTAWVEAAFLAKSLGGSSRRWLKRIIDVRPMVVHLDERSGLSPSPARNDDLFTTARRFGIPPERGHNALADAFVTAQLLLVVAGRLGQQTLVDLRSLQLLGRRSPAAPG